MIAPPRLSIVTPSFNQAAFIERTLRSVLDQGVNDLEFVVCDGGSTDATVDILRRYTGRVRWVSERDRGQADAVNKALRMTTGSIVGWLNSDDIYLPGSLAYVVQFFDEHPDVDVIYGDANHIDEHDHVIETYYTEDWNYERLKDVCIVCQPAVFFRRRVIDRYGMLDASLRYCMDYEYWLRIGATTPFVRVPYAIAGSRMYQENKTLGSRVPVHAEINTMLERRIGSVPSRWLYNYAFAVYDDRGWPRPDLHRHSMFFFRHLAAAHLRWRRTLPWSMFRTTCQWFWSSWVAARQTRGAS